jgi:glycosyltransferase involved in cell wall biosynthesis
VRSSIKRQIYRQGVKHLRSKPTIWTAHNLFPHRSRQADVDWEMTQLLINHCRGIMAMSRTAADLVREAYDVGDKIDLRVIPHGHYCDCYENQIGREQARTKLGIPADQFVYLSFGSLIPYKGHPELIDTFAKISGTEDRLLVVGHPSDADYVQQLAELAKTTAVRSRGTIQLVAESTDDRELQYYFNSADAVVLPFSNVLNSGSLLLAMSFGKPVVAPRIGSIPEIADPDSYVGYEPEDVDGLPAALRQVRKLAREPNAAPEKIIQRTRNKYSWDRIGGELKNWYQQLVSTH